MHDSFSTEPPVLKGMQFILYDNFMLLGTDSSAFWVAVSSKF